MYPTEKLRTLEPQNYTEFPDFILECVPGSNLPSIHSGCHPFTACISAMLRSPTWRLFQSSDGTEKSTTMVGGDGDSISSGLRVMINLGLQGDAGVCIQET